MLLEGFDICEKVDVCAYFGCVVSGRTENQSFKRVYRRLKRRVLWILYDFVW